MYKRSKNKKTFSINFYLLFLILILVSQSACNVRQLDSSQNPPQNGSEGQKKQENKTLLSLDKNTFLLVLIIGSAVFVFIALVCCVVCIVRCILKIERRTGFGKTKIGNISIDVANIWGGITYKQFQTYVGSPFQPHCVICLQEFEQQNRQVLASNPKLDKQNQIGELNFSNEIQPNIFYHSQPSPQLEPKPLAPARVQSRQTQYNEQQNVQMPDPNINYEVRKVKLTVCGHLLHQKCLNQWFEKEQNCPICRQEFNQQAFKIWGLRLGIDLIQFGAQLEFLERGLRQKCQNLLQESVRKKKLIQQYRLDYPRSIVVQNQTLNSIAKSRESNRLQQQYQNQYEFICQSEVNAVEKQILILFYVIMSYHRKNQLQKNFKGVEEIIQQSYATPKHEENRKLYFEETQPNLNNEPRQNQREIQQIYISRQARNQVENIQFGTTNSIYGLQEVQPKKRRTRSRISSKIKSQKPQEVSFYNQNQQNSNE